MSEQPWTAVWVLDEEDFGEELSAKVDEALADIQKRPNFLDIVDIKYSITSTTSELGCIRVYHGAMIVFRVLREAQP